MKQKIFFLFVIAIFGYNILFAQNKTNSIDTQAGKVFYEVSGSGTPIILLSGGPGAPPQSLNPLIEYLKESNKCLLLHQRGTGLSSKCIINAETVTPEEYMNDILSAMKKEGLDKTILLGHSWGTMLALNFMVKYPEKTKALILLGSPGYSLEFLPDMNNNMMKKLTQSEIDSIQSYSMIMNNKDIDSSIKKESSEKLMKIMLSKQFYNSELSDELYSYGPMNIEVNSLMNHYLSNIQWNLKEELEKTTGIPSVIINGSDDPIGLQPVNNLKQILKGSELHIIDECGHHLWIEKPNELKNVLLNFLQKN